MKQKTSIKAGTEASTPAKKAPPARKAPTAGFAEGLMGAPKSLLKAGMRALGSAPEPTGESGGPLATLERVFDQRVASALERLGLPSAAAVRELSARIDVLQARLDALDRRR